MTDSIRLDRGALDSEDVQRLIGLLNDELAATYPEPGANHFDLTAEDVAPGHGAVIIALDGDLAVGCAAVRLVGAGEAEIKRMFVVPSARGRGVSRRLLESLEHEARALGAARVVLETGERQRAALRLYESARCVRCERFGEYVDSPLSVCMEKHLPGGSRLWRPGETILQRFVGAGSGNLAAYPHVVVEDTVGQTIMFQPEGTVIEKWNMTERVNRTPMVARMHALRFVWPHRPYYVTLWFDAGTGVPPWYEPHFGRVEGRFKGWKGDMAAPHRRTAIGFDTTDDVLDLIVRPDRSWYVKDDDDLTGFVGAGVYTEAEAARIREACQELISEIEAGAEPFGDQWTDWQPDPKLTVGSAPAGWRELPGCDIHLSTLNYEIGLPGRHYDAWRRPDSPPLWSWREH